MNIFISCDDCSQICDFVNKHKLTNTTLEKLSLQFCIRVCKQCIKECKKHANQHSQEYIIWYSDELNV